MSATANRPGVHTLLPGQTPKGEHILSVLLKRTFKFVPSSRCVRADADRPIVTGDKNYGDPMNTTIQFAADFVPFKLATDVVLNGRAHAPQARPQREFMATLEVGQVKKTVRVIGDRVCKHRAGGDPVFGDPAPFERMELRYERAYGGVDVFTNTSCQYLYPRNHLGKGFAVTNIKSAIEDLDLPNFEDPNDLLTPSRLCCGKFENWPKQPAPVGFGWYAPFWQPRAGWAGILPADKKFEQEMRAAYAQLLKPPHREVYEKNELPVVDFRFFNGASPGLSLPYLAGDETIRLTNLTPTGTLTFQLPGAKPTITLDIGAGVKEEPVVLHTVQIRADDEAVDLVWRAAFGYGGLDALPEIKKYEIAIEG